MFALLSPQEISTRWAFPDAEEARGSCAPLHRPLPGRDSSCVFVVCVLSPIAQQHLDLSWGAADRNVTQANECPLEGGIPVGGDAGGPLWESPLSSGRSPQIKLHGGRERGL